MVRPKTEEEIELLRINGDLVSRTLAEVGKLVAPGVTTAKLNEVAETFIRDHGAVPSFKGFDGFPAALCMSVNDVVVHGFPSDRPLEEGDIVSVDCGTLYKGYNGDSAYTFPVGGGRQSHGRYRIRGAVVRRVIRFLRCPRIGRTRRWQRDARGPRRSQLREKGPRRSPYRRNDHLY